MKMALKTFARAVGWGAVAGGAPVLLFTLPAAILSVVDASNEGLAGLLYIATLPLLLAGAGTLAGALLLGLPLTALLRRKGRETSTTYGLLGAALGFVLPALAAFAAIGPDIGGAFLLFAIPGLIAGLTAATVWGNWREQVALVAAAAAQTPRPDRGERWLR